jgi:DNA-binding transcriptional LysR family regulator
MQLRDLEYFASIAEHGSVRRAAEALGLSQPGLSKSLRRLEQEMRGKLVARTPKGVELTAVGAALLGQVQRIRVTLDDVAREAADLSQGNAGRLRVGTSAPVSEHLQDAFGALLKESPRLALEVVVTDNDVMLPALRKGQLDLVVNYHTDSPYDGLVVEHVLDDEWVVCASSAHRLARHRRVSVEDLAQERWALASPVLPGQLLPKVFQEKRLPPPITALDTRSLHLRLQACASSGLLTCTSRRIVQKAPSNLRLKELPVPELIWRRPIGAFYRQGGYLSPAARRFVEILKAMTRKIAA